MTREDEGAQPRGQDGRTETGIDLGSVLAGLELDVPALAVTPQAPAGEMIDIAGLWSQIVFSEDAALDSLLGPVASLPAAPAGVETPLVPVWTFDPLPEPPVDY
jgi:hypothetical protein